MDRHDPNFLRRWSRLKREASAKPEAIAKTNVAAAAPELPPLEGLSFESDFAAFMHAKVDERLRRAALKKLFGDARFNIMDGLDVYIDDYSKDDPIPPGVLAQLQHARATLLAAQPEPEPPAEDPPPAEARPAVHADRPEPDAGAADRDA